MHDEDDGIDTWSENAPFWERGEGTLLRARSLQGQSFVRFKGKFNQFEEYFLIIYLQLTNNTVIIINRFIVKKNPLPLKVDRKLHSLSRIIVHLMICYNVIVVLIIVVVVLYRYWVRAKQKTNEAAKSSSTRCIFRAGVALGIVK